MKIKTVKSNIQKKKTASGKLFSNTGTSFFTPQNSDLVKRIVDSPFTAGHSLPAETKFFFESRFNYSFSNVKIHTGDAASKSAEKLNADAYTYGNNIVFNEGKYKPGTKEGNKLLAHELTHIIQNDNVKVYRQKKPVVDKKKELEEKLSIKIEKGDKDWNEDDISMLHSVLTSLSKNEAKILRNYLFIRWSTREARIKLDPKFMDMGTTECATHEMDFTTNIYKISIYDICFRDPEATIDEATGRFSLFHEIGHAMQTADMRDKQESLQNINRKHGEKIEEFNKAGLAEQKRMEPNLNKLGKAEEAAKTALENSKKRNIGEFEKLMKDKPAMSGYAETSVEEAFAEAFAFYKTNPQWMKKNYPKIFEWFSKGKFLPVVKPTTPERKK